MTELDVFLGKEKGAKSVGFQGDMGRWERLRVLARHLGGLQRHVSPSVVIMWQ